MVMSQSHASKSALRTTAWPRVPLPPVMRMLPTMVIVLYPSNVRPKPHAPTIFPFLHFAVPIHLIFVLPIRLCLYTDDRMHLRSRLFCGPPGRSQRTRETGDA